MHVGGADDFRIILCIHPDHSVNQNPRCDNEKLTCLYICHPSYAQIGYSAVGAVIFSLYIVYDTQLMLGGKHKHALSPEEYIFAALNLYLDIVNLFLYILAIFGGSKN